MRPWNIVKIGAVAGMAVMMGMAPGLAATPTDAAAIRIDTLDRALVTVAHAHTARERIGILAPVVAQTFNFAVMARYVVGAPFARMSRADQDAVSGAFARYMTARLAQEFSDVSDGAIGIDPAVQVRGADKVVRTTIAQGTDAPDRLDYRMRQYGDAWRVIDIFYNGVSELTTQRADLASTIATGSAVALVARIDAATARLSR